MELFFLGLLLFLMIFALTSGYPVAFALPGASIIALLAAAVSGYLIEGDSAAYFVEDGAEQWLSAGVTNFRSLYWNVERDTLIAIPLFIFMGIMLQRSKIAEDLLVAMAQLFGPLPGGLGISVVFVGALLAATTGIVGATVIAMGLISLPAMLRNNYSKSLATGTICASGTLGQIIPPSIVLIILADQLSSAADQANTARKELYRATTGEYSMPSQFEVVSASAGDMFMGALVPGVLLVGIYMLYILVVALIKPEKAPPVPYEGAYDAAFFRKTVLALVPPLSLIFIVLGSIILGVATVNQAGAIGAIGAMVMAGYRLHKGSWITYVPALLVLAALLVIGWVLSEYDNNIRNVQTEDEWQGIMLSLTAVGVMFFGIAWSGWRIFKFDNTLKEVMTETAKTTSMVFIILVGAAMLTSAFRAFGGEELVQHYLTSLPGGFWTQFLVVMLVIFLLGFFLDFIEIAVVVVPIVAPILLMNPEANVTAVWLGVMIGLNIQTSFLTPPFGFALFYLRGVADKVVKTMDIYKGATAFIGLQLLALVIAGQYPSLINYVPNRTHLLSETAPPPINPKLQSCLEDYSIEQYAENGEAIKAAIDKTAQLDISYLPAKLQKDFTKSTANAATSFAKMDAIAKARTQLDAYLPEYKPLHRDVRLMQSKVVKLDAEIESLQDAIRDSAYEEGNQDARVAKLEQDIKQLESDKQALEATLPSDWEEKHKQFTVLNKGITKAQRNYYNTVDGAYGKLDHLIKIIEATPSLKLLGKEIQALEAVIQESDDAKALMDKIKEVESALGDVDGASAIKSKLSKARRAIKKAKVMEEGKSKALDFLQQALANYDAEMIWREQAEAELLPELEVYDEAIAKTIGLRSQARLTDNQAKGVAACLSVHKDVSLYF